ncbi:sugar ABC transporter permease [Arthrobacter sp. MYb23]|uniref:ABC transporter permease n=1 Tax=unclassified Arthrobacter TaxID=235627 RepID=UPI000CFA97A6|nr:MULTISPECIES: ABC transporter permease [unclassified Arthrobacter]PRB43025.1 sugar ABC transporter permease [Arthrobacter sp. MYb51]PRB97978.1 sugar ABC transporter permease [Arthrobacter sp. MYb23]
MLTDEARGSNLAAQRAQEGGVVQRPKRTYGGYAMLALLLGLFALFSAILPGTFATSANTSTILAENAILGLLALSVMLPLIVNEYDLSLASVMGFCAMLAAGLPARQGMPWTVTALVVLAVGLTVGITHAVLVIRFKLPSFVVSLGTNSVLTGLILLYSNGSVIYDAIAPEFTFIGTTRIFGIGLPVYILAFVTAVLWFVLEKRPLGRKFYAIGANETAAKLAGIPTGRLRAALIIAAPVLASLAGIIIVGRVGSASPTSFSAYFLPAFAAAFLSLAGYKLGHYNALGVITAVYLIAVGVSGLSLLGAPSWVEPIFNGIALVVAIGLAHLLTRPRKTKHKVTS